MSYNLFWSGHDCMGELYWVQNGLLRLNPALTWQDYLVGGRDTRCQVPCSFQPCRLVQNLGRIVIKCSRWASVMALSIVPGGASWALRGDIKRKKGYDQDLAPLCRWLEAAANNDAHNFLMHHLFNVIVKGEICLCGWRLGETFELLQAWDISGAQNGGWHTAAGTPWAIFLHLPCADRCLWNLSFPSTVLLSP